MTDTGTDTGPDTGAKPGGKGWSLRRRLSLRVLGLVMGGWLATIALSAWVIDHEMNEMFDDELESLIETTILFLDRSDMPALPQHLGVVTRDGERVLRVLVEGRPSPAAPWPALATDGFHRADGWRILRRSAEGHVIEAAHTTAWRREEVAEAALALLVLALPLIGLLLWGLRRITAQALAPVSSLARSVARRAPDDLAPLDPVDLPRELRPLALAFDGHLARIEALRRSERDFIANAAHELRTPLAAIRARLTLSPDPDAAATLPQIDALTRRVERLLQLSRQEAGIGLGTGPTDLLRLLHLLLDEMRPRSRHPIRFDDADLTRLMVAADADALAILLRNALENAVEHGTGPVLLRLTPQGLLQVQNPAKGDGFLTTRFERGIGSAGHGLGLSIMAALAEAMGAAMQRDLRDGMAVLTLHLPLAAQG